MDEMASLVARRVLEFERNEIGESAQRVVEMLGAFETHLSQFNCVVDKRIARDATEAVTRWIADKPFEDTRALILCSQLRIRVLLSMLLEIARSRPDVFDAP